MKPLTLATRLMAASFVGAVLLSSCGEEHRSYVPNLTDARKTPTMTTTDVSTLISDSGFIRYHITTRRWDIYDDSVHPMWVFPDGLQLENYDLAMRPAATLVCDSATYYSDKRLWRLDGHIVMVNVKRDTFLTQQLFWDQRSAEVYSDSFVHIVRQPHIIEGYGFISDQTMSAYTVRRPTAIIPLNGNRLGGGGTAAGVPMPAPGPNFDSLGPGARPMPPEPASVRNARLRAASPTPP